MSAVRLVVAAAAVVLWGTAAGASVAHAEEPRPAATCPGVWVVVGDAVACATSHPTGEAALESAGHVLARSGGLVCRIDGVPDACRASFEAYWSYWQAERRPDGTYGAWRYATTGPATYVPRAGDAEGWVFGDGRQPPALLPADGSYAAPAEPVEIERPDGAVARSNLAAAPTAVTLATLLAGGSALAVAARRRGR